ncbi:MAG: Holliday junction resolvase RuvX [Lautropia sp.]|nr:Holliday junction resolvase RuvX [Lautropia sp.]
MNAPVQTLLAFDFGEKRIGVAVGNTLIGAAEPLATLTEPKVDDRFARIGELLQEWQPSRLVVGRPLHPDGAPHHVTALAEKFARRLEGRFGLPVSLVDERYSSVAAQARMNEADDWVTDADRDPVGGRHRVRVTSSRSGRKRRNSTAAAGGGDDAMAAAVILEQYLSENPS